MNNLYRIKFADGAVAIQPATELDFAVAIARQQRIHAAYIHKRKVCTEVVEAKKEQS